MFWQRLPTVSVAIIVASALSPTSVLAQTTPESSRRTSLMEEVLVTAQKREEAISDVPIAMQAFSGEALQKFGIVDTRDLAGLVPGLSFANSGKDTPIYTLRGIGFNDQSRSANAAVGVYIDEAPIAYPYMTQGANLDLNRIEVLKGPQGTLYGRNTTGGAINYIANKPTEAFEYGVEAEYSRFETLSVEGYVSGAIGDNLNARLALRHLQAREGWQVSLTRPNDRLGEKDKQAARLSLDWLASDSGTINFSVDYWRDRSEPQAPQAIDTAVQNSNFRTVGDLLGIVLGDNDLLLNPAVTSHPLVNTDDNRLADWVPSIPYQLDNEFLMPVVRGYWDVGPDTRVTVIAAYSKFETGDAEIPLSGLSNANNEITQKTSDAEALSLELRAEGLAWEDRLTWLGGIYASADEVSDFTNQRVDTNSGSFNAVPGVILVAGDVAWRGEQKAASQAVFGNVEFLLNDSLTMALGLRYTTEARDFEGCAIDPETNQASSYIGYSPILNARALLEGGEATATPGGCLTLGETSRTPSLIENSLDEENVGGKFALTWTPSEAHLFYASLSRGFKSGSFPIIPATEARQFDPVTQEEVLAVELGAKTSWLDDNLRINLAAFEYDYKDKQLTSFFVDLIFGPLPRLFNVPESTVRGAELEIQASPVAGLFLSLAASMLETEIKQYSGVNAAGTQLDFSGNELPFTPGEEVTLLANYSFPAPLLEEWEWTVGVDYSYVSEANSSIESAPVFKIPSYQLVNARLSLSDLAGSWDISAWVRNATNEFYQLNVPQFAADTVVRFTGMPQTVGLSVKYKYF